MEEQKDFRIRALECSDNVRQHIMRLRMPRGNDELTLSSMFAVKSLGEYDRTGDDGGHRCALHARSDRFGARPEAPFQGVQYAVHRQGPVAERDVGDEHECMFEPLDHGGVAPVFPRRFLPSDTGAASAAWAFWLS